MQGYSSGQRGQTVNLLTQVFGGSNPSPCTNYNPDGILPNLDNFFIIADYLNVAKIVCNHHTLIDRF